MRSALVRAVHEQIEVPAWAPWLRFSLNRMEAYEAAFPAGQLVVRDDSGELIGALTSLPFEWDGDSRSLGTWDAHADDDLAEALDGANANTLVLLSMAIRPDRRGQRVSSRLLHGAQKVARDLGLAHVVGPFRPSGFCEFKAEARNVDIEHYRRLTRDDGLPVDPWLRALTRLGMKQLHVCDHAMVAGATMAEFETWRASYHPQRWYRIDPETADPLVESVTSAGIMARVDEVWECGETGSWFLDLIDQQAVYVEANVWGELPIEVPSTGAKEQVVIDLRDIDDSPLIRAVRLRSPGQDFAVAWLGSTNPLSEIVRAHERRIFPDVAAFLDDEVEGQCRFLAVVDLTGEGRLVHAFRISSPRYGPKPSPDRRSGMPMVDEVVTFNDGLTLDEVLAHYREMGVNISECVAVETNFRLEGGVATSGLRWSDLGYVAIFQEVMRGADDQGERAVFAHLNAQAVRSLAAVDVRSEPFFGDGSLRSPGSEPGETDQSFAPSCLLADESNLRAFRALAGLAAFEVDLDVVDLRDSQQSVDLERRS